jgi:hypothetical protein
VDKIQTGSHKLALAASEVKRSNPNVVPRLIFYYYYFSTVVKSEIRIIADGFMSRIMVQRNRRFFRPNMVSAPSISLDDREVKVFTGCKYHISK